MKNPKRPVLIELPEDAPVAPQNAPVVQDVGAPSGQAMQRAAALAARPRSALFRWFWRLGAALMGFMASLWAWDALTSLVARNTYIGYGAIGLLGAFMLVCLAIILREWAAFARLRKLDGLRRDAAAALASADLGAAQLVLDRLLTLYRDRPDVSWGHARVLERRRDILDGDGLLSLAEVELTAPLDQQARREIEAAARQVATVTAIVPLPLADMLVALAANLRMIRRIAEIYGGRAGTLGSWRLTRSVLTHLVATGAVAVGDDLIGSIAGGGVLSKISRRFGEGVINGALTARVGVAAMEVCRPLPFHAAKRPSVTRLLQRALTGLFATSPKA